MQYRKLFNRSISEIGIGTWQLGGSEWGDISRKQAHSILGAALDSGINFIDTADVYGAGRSESLIGDFLRSRRDQCFVATKLGRLHGYPDGYSYQQFVSDIDDSLRRLQVEQLDLVQLHCLPDAALQAGEVFTWLKRLQQADKILHWGASVESDDQALLCLQQPGLSSLQIIFNVFRQKPATTVFARAQQQGVALIIRLPLNSGMLSGKFSSASTFPEQDHRNFNKDGEHFNVGETFGGIEFATGLQLVDQLRPLIPEGMSMVDFALRWILDHPEVGVIIPGASKIEQVAANCRASSLPQLKSELQAQLKDFYQQRVHKHIRGIY